MVDFDVKGKWRISVDASFAAAHALRHYEGKCERIHGHNFDITAVLEGTQLQEDVGILLDFKILRQMLGEVLAPLDHRLLNDVPPFDVINPSSENLARFIAAGLARILKQKSITRAGIKVASVTVSEKPGQSATWIMAE